MVYLASRVFVEHFENLTQDKGMTAKEIVRLGAPVKRMSKTPAPKQHLLLRDTANALHVGNQWRQSAELLRAFIMGVYKIAQRHTILENKGAREGLKVTLKHKEGNAKIVAVHPNGYVTAPISRGRGKKRKKYSTSPAFVNVQK